MRRLLTVLGLLLTSAAGIAADPYIPPELEPWREWVLHGEDHLACPFFAVGGYGEPRNHLCAWAGPLVLETTPSGAAFRQTWQLYREGWITLPGDARHWPDEVRADGQPASVVFRGGRPQVLLPAGEHRLAGLFAWSRQPASLPIPAETGLVSLTLDGTDVPFPRVEGGRVLLGSKPAASGAVEALRITVHRRLADGIPVMLDTRLRLEVSGPGRELLLGRLLPEGFVPVSLTSPLPARIEADGRLRMQLRPGEWVLTARARASTPMATVVAPSGDGTWAESEIWSWQANDRLRVTTVDAPNPVDPVRVNVPPTWGNLPAFRLDGGQDLTIDERSRGLSGSRQNRLSLRRLMWRDFDGGGYTTVDTVTGQMETDWRLDMARPYRLESASAGGDNLLVTHGADATLSGVEVRNAQLALETIGRVPAATPVLPATGWTVDFADVHTSLSLPPAHRLVAAFGVDRTRGDWIGQWRLLDYFLVLLVAVALGRLFGAVHGATVLVLLVLAYHEPGAPIWVWLIVAAFVALARFAPEGRLRRVSLWGRNAAFALLVLLALPFAAHQLRLAVFPQLEPGVGQQYGAMPGGLRRDAAVMRDMQMAPTAEPEAMAEEIVVTGSRIGGADADDSYTIGKNSIPPVPARRYAEGTLVQTGPGVPQWGRGYISLHWSGPVSAGQTMRLVILPPAVLRSLRVLVVLLLAVALWRMARRLFDMPALPRPPRASAGTAGAVLLAVAATAAVSPQPARAEALPDDRLLGELKQRLLEPPDCAPRCAELRSARIDIADAALTMDLAVDALDGVAVALPGSSGGWRPRSVRVDGRPVSLFFRDNADVLWLALEPGQHRLELAGPLPPADSVQIPFAEAPRRVRVNAAGWEVSGVVDGRLASGALELVRIRAAGDEGAVLQSERFPVFVEVARRLSFDVDWQVHTVVSRIAPTEGGFSVSIPLIDGEQPLDEALDARDGAVTVSLSANASQRAWTSSLAPTSPLTLRAPAAAAHAEVWRLIPGPAWRLTYDDVPVIAMTSAGSRYSPEFRPLPGETLVVELVRPEAVEGRTLTFDRVHLEHSQGRRGSDSTLSVAYRSTRGGTHAITLPDDAQVTGVTTDGMAQPVRPVDGTLSLPVLPGAHEVAVVWRADTAMSGRIDTPRVDLNADAGNVHLQLSLPSDRWVLMASGPALGPAVLYWSELAVFVLIALGLGRVRTTPLRTHHWLLLGLGFSTFSWGVLLLIGLWLFALARRRNTPMPASNTLYNLVQVALALLTVATLAALLIAIPQALLGYPDMHVTGNGSSSGRLLWFSDRIAGQLPGASAWSVPLWVYKGAILLWALWLAFALLRWLPWAWQSWSEGGLWRGRIVTAKDAARDDEQ